MNNYIKTYIRDENRRPYGVVVALKKDGKIGVGYSITNPRDNFDRDMGNKIAFGRAEADINGRVTKVPTFDNPKRTTEVEFAINQMQSRAIEYFK